MKIVGTNQSVVLTREKAEFWLGHQANQRNKIERHVNALAKLLARVGWRNDQRICITEDNEIVNGLQRLSAIYSLQDFGWKIPVTVYKKEELTADVIESFNVQKSDSMHRLMVRQYGWNDKRRCSVCQSIMYIIDRHTNATSHDVFDVYEHLKEIIDSVLSVQEKKKRGSNSVSVEVYVAAVCCALEGYPIERFVDTANNYCNDDAHEPIWKALKDWRIHWKSRDDIEYIAKEPFDLNGRIAVRYSVIRDYLNGKRITPISSLSSQKMQELCQKVRDIIRAHLHFD